MASDPWRRCTDARSEIHKRVKETTVMNTAEVPASVRGRISKLLAMAQDTRGNEHETQAAAAKVQDLLASYNLEMAQFVEADDAAEIDPDAERQKCDEVVTLESGDWREGLFRSIADANFCMRFIGAWTPDEKRIWSLVGRRVNIAKTHQVYHYLTQ